MYIWKNTLLRPSCVASRYIITNEGVVLKTVRIIYYIRFPRFDRVTLSHTMLSFTNDLNLSQLIFNEEGYISDVKRPRKSTSEKMRDYMKKELEHNPGLVCGRGVELSFRLPSTSRSIGWV